MKNILFIVILWSTGMAYCQDLGQELTVDHCRDQFAKQTEVFPQEKIYLHTDRSTYLTGDTLWFKAYLTDAVVHLPSQLSRFAYVELVNPWGRIDKRIKVKMGKGDSYSQIEIPENLPDGNYYVRAYTGTMYGMPHEYFFSKRIYIASTNSPGIQEHLHYNFDKEKITMSFYFTDSNSGEKIDIKDVSVSVNGNTSKTLRMNKNNTAQMTFQIPTDDHGRILHLQFAHEKLKFDKYLNIPYPEEVFDVKFFPEGGNLIEGEPCLIGMKAVNGTGYSEQVSGFITDNKGNRVIEDIQTLYNGMGSFRMTPQKDKTYHATMTNANGDTQVFLLPSASKETMALSAEWRNNNLRISVKGLSPLDELNPKYLLIHSRGITHYVKEWDSRKNSSLLISKKNLPLGVLQILLLNSDYEPVSERMVFCMNDDYAHIKLKTEKQDSQIALDVSLTDNKGKALTGNFSVSVTNDNYTSVDEDIDIFAYMLLSSEIEGHIEDPTFYFREDERNRLIALDNLLLTQGWRRYNIPQVAKGNMKASTGFVELGQEITGTVRSLLGNKGMTNAKVRILSLENMYANEITADEKGVFHFDGLDFMDNTKFVIQAFNQKGKDRVSLSVNEDSYPEILPSDLYFSRTKNRMTENFGRINSKNSFLLQEVEVTAYKPKEEDIPIYSRTADVSFDNKKIKELDAVCMHELLRRIPGVNVTGNKVVIRGHSSIYADSYAAIAVDGVIVTSSTDGEISSEFDLDIINMPDVERVDVFKGGSTVIWGHRGGNGVVSITTKRGNFDISKIDDIKYNTKNITVLGYTAPCEYYTAKYNIQESLNYNLKLLDPTVFWAPDITSDKKGKASVSFDIPDKDATYSVLIQGITDDGQIINALHKI